MWKIIHLSQSCCGDFGQVCFLLSLLPLHGKDLTLDSSFICSILAGIFSNLLVKGMWTYRKIIKKADRKGDRLYFENIKELFSK